MKKYIHRSNYFCGNEVSDYGKKHGYVDYATLAKSFDAVLCNDITKLFYSDVNGEYSEAEQVSGIIDNQDEIDELQEQLDDIYYNRDELLKEFTQEQLDARESELQERIDELQREQDECPEIYQYFIVSDAGAEILKDCDEIVYYIPALDVYVWGVTHYGTSWDYVLTNIKIEMEGETR